MNQMVFVKKQFVRNLQVDSQQMNLIRWLNLTILNKQKQQIAHRSRSGWLIKWDLKLRFSIT